MIFVCGVRFMRFKSAGLNGCASGSASAAHSMALLVMARIPLRRLFEVSLLLKFRRPPGRDDSDGVVSLRVGNVENEAIDHAYDYESLLFVILPVVKKLNGKRVAEDTFCQSETDAM